MMKARLWGCSALVAPVLLALAPSVAAAQQPAPPAQAAPAQPPEDEEDATEVEVIVSTGSFIRGTPEDSALPVTVITRQELLSTGDPTMSDLIRTLTEVGNVQGEYNGFDSSGTGAASIGLRGLGPGRTIVLMNGRRLADEPQESALTGGTFQNLNAIPRGAMQQVEVLKDGGATTYGADAVGGVVNFITRRDLDGTEASASYRYIADSDGDYDANILWGKRWEDKNILLSFTYAHRSPLAVNDRDFARKPFLENPMAAINNIGYNGWDIESNPGAYIFQTAGNAAANTSPNTTALPLNTSFQGIRPAGIGINAFNATGALAISPNGIIRDPNCAALGGYGSFGNSTLGAPLCFQRANEPRYLVEKTENVQIFIDGNIDFTENFSFNSNFLLSVQVLPEIHQGSSQNISRFYCAGLTDNAPDNPILTNAGAPTALRSANRNCVRNLTLAAEGVTTTGASGVGFYSASGLNPAVLDFMRRHDILNQARALVDVFREDQVRRVAGLNPVTGAYDPTQTPGRVQLLDQIWRPFGLGGNPAFGEGQETTRSEFSTFRTTQTLKGSLGKIFGAVLDFEVSGTYSHNYTVQEDRGILVDRLERALNGFATNLDDPDGDTCTVTETLGSRTFGNAAATPTTSVPFIVGAGGGAGTVVPGWVGGGNGCYFFNPFSSAIAKNVFSGQVNNIGRDGAPGVAGQVGFAGGPEVGGTTANQQGYALGYGLANAPGIVRWLYEDRRQKTKSDYYLLDMVLNGETGFELPGGPVNFAIGGQYRLTERKTRFARLNNTEEFDCTFADKDAGPVDDFAVYATSTCGTGGGGLFTDGRISGQPSERTSPVIAAFAELALPLHDRIFLSISGRNEIAKNFRVPDVEAFIPAASIKWQVNDNFALRATVSETFSSVTPPEANQTITTTITPFGGGLATLPVPAEIISNSNTELQPETGFNYNVGLIFQGRGMFATVDYFNIEISGRPNGLNATTIARAITGNITDGLDATNAINCSLPATKILTENEQPILGGRPVVTLIDGSNPCSAAGGATLSGAGGTPLSIAFVSTINAGTQKTSGIDANFTWRIPEQILGGNLTLTTQGTWNLTWVQEQGVFFGAPIGSISYDGLGSTNLDVAVQGKSTLGQISIFRGGAGFNYQRGKHNFNWQTRFVTGAVDDRGYEYVRNGALATLAAIVNYNPDNPAGCDGRYLFNPNTKTDPLGAPGVGIRPLNQNCNVVNTAGIKIPGTFNTDVTWRYDLSSETVIAVSVNNLFDADPPFTRLPIAYNSYGALTALGRNIRLGIEKKF